MRAEYAVGCNTGAGRSFGAAVIPSIWVAGIRTENGAGFGGTHSDIGMFV